VTEVQQQAPRLRRPSWRDTRLLVGVLLVLISVALGARVIAAADSTVEVLAAGRTLPAGSPLAAGDLRVVRVHLGDAAGRYLPAGSPPGTGTVVIRTVSAGELIPRSALGAALPGQERPVVIPLDPAVAAGLTPGARVDVWASAKDRATGSAGYLRPQRLATAVEVFAVSAGGNGLTAAQQSSVQVLVGQPELTGILDALANDSRLAVVPVLGAR
jgi:Flp pilus assembly protein CpaB